MDIGYYNLNWDLVCLIEPHFVIKKKSGYTFHLWKINQYMLERWTCKTKTLRQKEDLVGI